MTQSVIIHEVAPRDGFQSVKELIQTDEKIRIIEGLIASGFPRIEIGSFVSPKAIPQMADIVEIAKVFASREDFQPYALVPNARGVENALKCGIKNLVYVFSASESHNQSNVRQSVEESILRIKDISELVRDDPDVNLRIAVGTSFHCPFEGDVPLDSVVSSLDKVFDLVRGAEIALCDTTGKANPFSVKAAFEEVIKRYPSEVGWAFHGHDTYGLGIANALFAYDAGVRIFDASAAGLGGCPFAPGATGNTASEDLVFALEGAGIDTGVDMLHLLGVADEVSAIPGGVVSSHLRKVPRDRIWSACIGNT